MRTIEREEYPFNDGDDYWTVEGNAVIYSCWDEASEEMHDENPNQVYFRLEAYAILHILKAKK